MNGLVARQLSALKPRAQTINLIIDFSPAFFQRIGERRIYVSQLLLKRIQLSIKCAGRMIEGGRGFLSEVFGDYSADHVIGSGKEINQADIVAIQGTPGMLLDHRHARAMKNGRDRPIENTINLSRLGEICD